MTTARSLRPLLVLAAGGALLATSGCAATTASGGSGERIDGGTVVYAHQQEPPCVFGGWIEQAYLSYQVLDSLLSLDEDGTPVPWLADSYEVSDDQLTWSFHLKPDVTFTDGSALTAEVVAYNFDYWVGGGNSTAAVWLGGYYESAEAVDELTLAVHLSQAYPALAQTVTQGYFGIQSQEALENRTDEENCAAPVGSGAFTVEEWNRGSDIQLVRNDDYTSWPANALHTGPANVERVDWRFVADATTRVAALQSEEVDAIYDVPAVSWKALDDGGYELHKYVTAGRPQQLTFNTSRGVFADEKVRQAFAYSLDREQTVETIGQGLIPFEGNGGVSQSTPGYSQKAADWYDYDPDAANALLDDAGWTEKDADGIRSKDGEPLAVVLPYGAGSIINADGAAILQAVQEQAKTVGFDVELIPVPQSELFAGAYSQSEEKDISVGYWTAVTSGILYINWRQSTPDNPNYWNQAFYDSPELEGYILEGNSALDEDQSFAAYSEAQDYIAEHALAIGLYDRLSTLAVGTKLKDVWQEHAQGGPVFYDAYLVD